ncbi:hypothetical protein N8T08_009781 [Aspergillus melleus]|uniref:Uncharacterized protein n=1 Tax=Aspergillus melleus TaxID=138277 RepID=A0ACC3AT30_9EURO|nr:hypothetical protein N8T08_009781 [Aspergillus melleus]
MPPKARPNASDRKPPQVSQGLYEYEQIELMEAYKGNKTAAKDAKDKRAVAAPSAAASSTAKKRSAEEAALVAEGRAELWEELRDKGVSLPDMEEDTVLPDDSPVLTKGQQVRKMELLADLDCCKKRQKEIRVAKRTNAEEILLREMERERLQEMMKEEKKVFDEIVHKLKNMHLC